jgi:hypothetical protein
MVATVEDPERGVRLSLRCGAWVESLPPAVYVQ